MRRLGETLKPFIFFTFCLLFSILNETFAFLPPKKLEDLAQRYNEALLFAKKGDYKKAEKLLLSLLATYGGSEYGSEIRYALAEVYFNAGDFANAKKIFEYLAFEGKSFSYLLAEALYGYALSCVVLGEFGKAEDALKKISANPIYKEDERVQFAYGVLNYFQGEEKLAAARLMDVKILEGRYFYGKALAKLGSPLEALSVLKEVASSSPNTQLSLYAKFHQGLSLYLNGDYEGAAVKFESFLKEAPPSLFDYASYFYATSLLGIRKYEKAISLLRPLTRHPNNLLAAQANYFIGVAYMGLGKYTEAIAAFERTRSSYPKTKVALFANIFIPYALMLRGDTLETVLTANQLRKIFSEKELAGLGDYFVGILSFQLGNYGEAANSFERVITSAAEAPIKDKAASLFLLSLLNKILKEKGGFADLEKGVAIVQRYLKENPLRDEALGREIYYLLGETYYYLNRYSEAEFYYDQVRNPYGRLGKAYCLYASGRLKEAIPIFENLYKSLPTDTLFTISALLGLAYSYFNSREYEKALDIFEGVIEEFPENQISLEIAHFYAGFCYYFLKYYGQAVEHWQKVLDKFPFSERSAEAGFRAGDVYFKAREYEQARGIFRFVVERFPKSEFAPPSQALIAQSYYNEKNYKEAVREYLKFLDLFPEDVQAGGVKKSLELSYYKASEEDTLILKEFLDKFPESEYAGELLLTRAKEYLAANEPERAISELTKVVVALPGSELAGDAQLLIAETYTNMKNWEEAKRSYEKFLRYFPNHPAREVAYFNLATTLFNLGDYEKALENFQVVIDSFPAGELRESATKNIDLCKKRLGKE
ncbi:MAG: tetratricopeptide repeat protein [candidate division WOR-3 bacterium]